MTDATTDAIRKRWNRQEKSKGRLRPRWWKAKEVWRHINAVAYEQPSDDRLGFHAFLAPRLAPLRSGTGLVRGLSVGAGIGAKELNLLRLGIVDRFDLFDLSPKRRDQALADAAALGLEDRITYSVEDAFASCRDGSYDLLYWHAALHHMFGVPKAVAWSRRMLRPGSAFVFNEYVGPRRFQWPEADRVIAQRARDAVPASIRYRIAETDYRFDDAIWCPGEAWMIEHDPSESVDSEGILPAVAEQFADRTVLPLGGLLYMKAIGDAIPFVRTDAEKAWLRDWLHVDWGLGLAGRTYFAAGIGWKPAD